MNVRDAQLIYQQKREGKTQTQLELMPCHRACVLNNIIEVNALRMGSERSLAAYIPVLCAKWNNMNVRQE